ncbi:MAG: 3-hydroxyacyl-CoA dehydrogenase, partial [Gammaproteobacteria bacterium]
AGGTQRVPRLAGVGVALDLITKGNPIAAGKAKSFGLLDKVIEADLLEGALLNGALAYANELVATGATLRRVSDMTIDKTTIESDLFENYRNNLSKRARGQIAPFHIVSCIEAAVELPMEAGLKLEREKFVQCLESTQSSAMRHMFFAERQAAKINGIDKETKVRNIASVAIIGGGTMGGGIAMNFANAGSPVKLLEINDEALARGLKIVENNYNMSVTKGKLTEQQKQQYLALIQGTISYQDLAEVDLVIEAVFEDLEIKKQVFSKLDTVCKPGAILATNTSYQDVNLIAEATQRPEDVIGLHFFSPANVMKLLEVVRADKTSNEVIATTMKLAKAIRKVPVLSGVCYGFIGNRMLRHYAREAQLCLIEGSSPEQIDKVMQQWGMAMGPLAVGDLAGLDIAYKARQALTDEQKGDPRSYCIPDALVERGRLGQKTAAGYYNYDPKTRARSSDDSVMELVKSKAEEQGIERREIGDEEICNRLIFALINEGAKILEEGISQRPGDIDVVYAFGYGFPVSRGGPMHYADTIGLDKVYQTICQYQQQLGGDYWQPSALLKELAENGGSFDLWAKQRS